MGLLKKGMGVTIGNSLRRVLLSALSGSAMTSLKIDGISHEFSAIDNVREDVLEIVCNLKSVVYKSNDDEQKEATIKINGKKNVTLLQIFNVLMV